MDPQEEKIEVPEINTGKYIAKTIMGHLVVIAIGTAGGLTVGYLTKASKPEKGMMALAGVAIAYFGAVATDMYAWNKAVGSGEEMSASGIPTITTTNQKKKAACEAAGGTWGGGLVGCQHASIH